MQRFDCLAKDAKILGPHFLEASAGTGKTFAIEHVVARLILSGKVELEQILVVTFTRAAARELKLRIRSNLDRIANNFHGGLEYLVEDADCSKISDALATFDRCQIFTIHSFCSRMLTEFGLEAGINNMGGDAMQSVSLKREAGIRDFLESKISPDVICPEQLEILLRWAGSIEELVHHLKTTAPHPESKTFLQRSQEFHSLCMPVEMSKIQEDWKALQSNYKKVKGDLEGQINALAMGDFAKLIQEKGSIFQFLSPENKKVRAKDPPFLHYPQFFDWGKVHLLPLVKSAADPKTILNTLLAIWKPIDRKILLEGGMLSNDELLLAMQRAVQIDAFRHKVGQKYGAVLIDEFQDTDPVQWEIFQRLFLSGAPKTVYLIGDPKQSIYRFRKADLYTYLSAKQSIAPEGHFYLDTNFRSSGELIHAMNHLFDRKWLHLPQEKTTLPYIPVHAGLNLKTEFQDGKGAIHCVLIGKEDIYAYVASEIVRMRAEVPHFRDWAVLVKDRYEAAAMQKVFAQVGIPSSCRGKELLSETLAFEAIYELLQALESPGHIGLAKRVLAGPFGNLSSAQIQSLELSPFGDYRCILDEKGLSLFFQAFFRHRPGVVDPQFHSDCLQVLEHLFEWEQRMGFSFDGVFRFLESFARMIQDEAVFQRKEEGEDDVQIMTVHMSKGLEFSLVFALGLASRTPRGDEEAEAEKLRQFYVAATRAKKRLYIPIPISTKEAMEGTHSPMELFCRCLSPDGNWEGELQRIASLASLSLEKVLSPVSIEPLSQKVVVPLPKPAIQISLPPFQSSYLLSFTSLSKGTEFEVLDPLPEGDLPRGAQTGTLIHRIFERIFSEKNSWKTKTHVSRIVKEELARSPLVLWEKMVDEMVQKSLDLPLPQGFCLRDLDPSYVRAEVEFVFEASGLSHKLLPKEFMGTSSSPNYLKGFIDLLFMWKDKLYFVDWKTNWLPNYEPEQLRNAIISHSYDLQASIYAEALQKNKMTASAIYLFVRGPGAICFEPNGYPL